MDRAGEIRKVLIYVLVLNWAVAIAKLIVGYLTKSNSMVADGLHSFSDGSANIVGLVGISFASKPVDDDHPYGHKKYETFTAIGIAILLLLVCFNVFHESMGKLRNPVAPTVNLYSFIVMALTITVNIMVMNYEFRKGKKMNSDILVSDSMHTRADILTSLSVIVALIASKFGYPIIDVVVSVIIALFIGYAAYDILRDASRVLCDTAAIDIKRIEAVVRSIDGVMECHKIRTRGREDDIHIDMHVLVQPSMRIDKAHELSYKIEDTIKREFAGVTDIVVHLEPAGVPPR